MIIDTSALVAVGWREAGDHALFEAMLMGDGIIPAPVLVEFRRVSARQGNVPDPLVDALLAEIQLAGTTILPFTAVHAQAATIANVEYGSGNGRGGPLNMLDLMVYAVAKTENLPILCTGKDFAATDATIHPASRRY